MVHLDDCVDELAISSNGEYVVSACVRHAGHVGTIAFAQISSDLVKYCKPSDQYCLNEEGYVLSHGPTYSLLFKVPGWYIGLTPFPVRKLQEVPLNGPA